MTSAGASDPSASAGISPITERLRAAGLGALADNAGESASRLEKTIGDWDITGSEEPRRPKCLLILRENRMLSRYKALVKDVTLPDTLQAPFDAFSIQCNKIDAREAAYRLWSLCAIKESAGCRAALDWANGIAAAWDTARAHLTKENALLRQLRHCDDLDSRLADFREAEQAARKADEELTKRAQDQSEAMTLIAEQKEANMDDLASGPRLERIYTTLKGDAEAFARATQDYATLAAEREEFNKEKGKLKDDRAEWKGSKDKELDGAYDRGHTDAFWEATHLAQRATAVTLGKARYNLDIAWKYQGDKGLLTVRNPDHPYWQGRQFAQWLLEGDYLENKDSLWYNAQKLESKERYSLAAPVGKHETSWFAGIANIMTNEPLLEFKAAELPTSPESKEDLLPEKVAKN
ncbi:hypothetical protein NX059_000373 [Plenodomus lindquistii]|nr:hypothetical protein NX059_000373 [Plenodomus lindquistii]